MHCESPISITHGLNPLLYPEGLVVPCGKCLQCRISYRREWSARMLHEDSLHDRSSFITLTYDDKNIHCCSSLVKPDLQKFFKKVRKRLSPKNRKIKYFAVGEYGEQTERPHYHAIMFGLGLQPEDKQIVIDSWNKCDWDSLLKNSAPGQGPFGKVEPHSIQYVASYIDKKYDGDLAWCEYELRGRDPVFRLISNGIGKGYCEKHKSQFEENMKMTVNGRPQSLPRYYLDMIEGDRAITKQRLDNEEKKSIKKITGEFKKRSDLISDCDTKSLIKIDKVERSEREQKSRNARARLSMKKARKI